MTTSEMEEKVLSIRRSVITMIAEAGSGHTAGSLGIVEILVSLYFNILNHDPKNPNLENRDRFILSNGHTCPALYATMSKVGYFPKEELPTLRKLNSRLQGHPHNSSLPGIEFSSGPLGQGASVAVGMALAAKLDQKEYRVYCILSDGEHDEGQVWESVLFAAKNKLDNLTFIVDRNNIQIDGTTEEIMPLEPFSDKYKAFNWQTLEVDGHNIEEIIEALNNAKSIKDKPTVIIAHTIPGKGVKSIEGDYVWHGKAPTKNEAAAMLNELGAV